MNWTIIYFFDLLGGEYFFEPTHCRIWTTQPFPYMFNMVITLQQSIQINPQEFDWFSRLNFLILMTQLLLSPFILLKLIRSVFSKFMTKLKGYFYRYLVCSCSYFTYTIKTLKNTEWGIFPYFLLIYTQWNQMQPFGLTPHLWSLVEPDWVFCIYSDIKTF